MYNIKIIILINYHTNIISFIFLCHKISSHKLYGFFKRIKKIRYMSVKRILTQRDNFHLYIYYI
jgi:hypothetical protein